MKSLNALLIVSLGMFVSTTTWARDEDFYDDEENSYVSSNDDEFVDDQDEYKNEKNKKSKKSKKTVSKGRGDKSIRFGVHAGLGYNSLWGIEEKVVIGLEEESFRSEDYNSSTGRREEFTVRRVNETYITDGTDISGMGFSLGGSILYPLISIIDLQAELLLAYRSRSVDATMNNDHKRYDDGVLNSVKSYTKSEPMGEISISTWNFDFPIMVRYDPGEGLFFGAGPVVSLNLATDVECVDEEIDFADFASTLNLGLIAVGGYSMSLGKGSLDIDLRFIFGLTNLLNDSGAYKGVTMETKDWGSPSDLILQVGATYWFM